MLNPLTWNVRLESNGGSDAELVVEAKIERGWHLYDIKLPKDGPVLRLLFGIKTALEMLKLSVI